MAKPISATPILRGEDARRFIKNMIKKQNSKPTKREIEIAKQILAHVAH